MTWIKPSFLWMMYRAGWATKPHQECVLAIRRKRRGFECALRQSAMSAFDRQVYADRLEWQAALLTHPVRVQWDPEKDMYLQQLPYRSVQIGLSGAAVTEYISDWIIGIEHNTPLAQRIVQLFRDGADDVARSLLPVEIEYPSDDSFAAQIAASRINPV